MTVVSAELKIEGQYIKHSDNHGFVNTGIERNTPHAFSHFTFEASQRRLVVVDIQVQLMDKKKMFKLSFRVLETSTRILKSIQWTRKDLDSEILERKESRGGW